MTLIPVKGIVLNWIICISEISKRLELASGFRVTPRFASSQYQVTNYGLGGLCEIHMDPWGYLMGVGLLVDDREKLVASGDIHATFRVSTGIEKVYKYSCNFEVYKNLIGFLVDLSLLHVMKKYFLTK